MTVELTEAEQAAVDHAVEWWGERFTVSELDIVKLGVLAR